MRLNGAMGGRERIEEVAGVQVDGGHGAPWGATHRLWNPCGPERVHSRIGAFAMTDNSQTMTTIRAIHFKSVMRWDKYARLFRLFRIMWKAEGGGYLRKFSVALRARPRVNFWREGDGWLADLLIVRLHFRRSYDERFV